MKRLIIVLLFIAGSVLPSAAQQQFIVRDSLGASGVRLVCAILQCTPGKSLGDPSGQLFVVTNTGLLSQTSFLTLLVGQFGVVSVEVDQQMNLGGPFATSIPQTLEDSSAVVYFG